MQRLGRDWTGAILAIPLWPDTVAEPSMWQDRVELKLVAYMPIMLRAALELVSYMPTIYSGTPLIRTLVGPTASVLIREVSIFQGSRL